MPLQTKMFRISLLAKNGTLLTEKTLRMPSFERLRSSSFSLHKLHNQFKRCVGKILGSNTYTIADNDELIKELIMGSKNGLCISDKDITNFIEINNAHKKTTVFFEKHWKYRFMIANLPLFYLDYRVSQCYIPELLAFSLLLHIPTFYCLPMDEGQNLTEVARARRVLQRKINTEKIMQSWSPITMNKRDKSVYATNANHQSNNKSHEE